MEIQKATRENEEKLENFKIELNKIHKIISENEMEMKVQTSFFKNMSRHLNKEISEEELDKFFTIYLENPYEVINNLKDDVYIDIKVPAHQRERMGKIGVLNFKIENDKKKLEELEKNKFNTEVDLGMYVDGI